MNRRTTVLLRRKHRSSRFRNEIRTNSYQHLLWSTSSTELDDVWHKSSWNSVQSVSHGKFLLSFSVPQYFNWMWQQIGNLSEPLWSIEARNAAIANSYFTVAINRVGIKVHGLLIAEMDLNLCRQAKDHWGFRLTQRLPLYAESLTNATKLDFQPQLIREN